MITHLATYEIDRGRWDECISRAFNGIIYGYSWYLDVVCPGWEGLVEDDYKSVMPLTCGKKMGVAYLFPPFFVQQLGVFSVNKLTEEEVKQFLSQIPAKYRYWEINFNTFNKIPQGDYSLTPHLTHELDLIDSYENLFKQYSENTRRNVRKAEKNNLNLIEKISHEEVISLFRTNRGKDVAALGEVQYDILRRLLKAVDARQRLVAFGVADDAGKLTTGAFFILANNKAIFLFSGMNELGRESGAMFYVIDQFIRRYANHNLILDFEGSDQPDLARFYKSFGAKECVYLQAKQNRLPWYLSWYKR
ncbi:MAG: hypothetical protein ACRCYO_03560 [Bacteroidia bacterium]